MAVLPRLSWPAPYFTSPPPTVRAGELYPHAGNKQKRPFYFPGLRCAKVFSNYQWGQDNLLLQLADDTTAKAKFPGWYASSLAKGFYTQAVKAVHAHSQDTLKTVGQLVLTLQCSKDSKERHAVASQAKGVAGAFNPSQSPLQQAVLALVDVIVLTNQHGGVAPSVFKQTLSATLTTACGVVQVFPDWVTSLKAMELPEDFVRAALTAATHVISTDKSKEASTVLKDLQNHIKTCLSTIAGVPDPAESEKTFLTFMTKNGSKISGHMKKVIDPLLMDHECHQACLSAARLCCAACSLTPLSVSFPPFSSSGWGWPFHDCCT